MKVKFKQTKYRPVYSCNGYSFNADGQVLDIDEKEAYRISKDFPENFELVKEMKSLRPKRDKAFKADSDK